MINREGQLWLYSPAIFFDGAVGAEPSILYFILFSETTFALTWHGTAFLVVTAVHFGLTVDKTGRVFNNSIYEYRNMIWETQSYMQRIDAS